MRNRRTSTAQTGHQAGVGLIELMVALVLGLFLIFGAVTIYQQSRTAFRTAEAVARLQEVGRLAMDVMESDVRMASYWGLNNRAEYIVNRASLRAEPARRFHDRRRALIIDTCGGAGSNWAINLDLYIVGSNNSYNLTCATVPASYCNGRRRHLDDPPRRRRDAGRAGRRQDLPADQPHPGHAVRADRGLHRRRPTPRASRRPTHRLRRSRGN